ncbi:MAG: CopG family transcriptional regulator [Burkholderiaceae bacterium]|nr:CopG family transcriptional regulator [Burkholderiaceae bacterium]
MEQKTARLTLLIDPDKKAAFERLCASQDLTPSQVIRKLIREYLAVHKVEYTRTDTASRATIPRTGPRRSSRTRPVKARPGGGR